jgi:hypothetical protein
VIVPLSFASLGTGLVQALGTPWGLLRHYWVLAKLLLGMIAVTVLLLKIAPISALGGAAAAGFSAGDLRGLRISVMAHAAGGLLVLLAATALAVYKPQGIVGQRMPRWVKTFGVALLVLTVVLAHMTFSGRHGPGGHALS